MTEVTEDTPRLYLYLDVMCGCYRWVMRSLSGETLARSTGCYVKKAGCLSDAEALKPCYPGTILRNLTLPA